MFKTENNGSIKEEIQKVKLWKDVLPKKGGTKIFINNWMNLFLFAVKIKTKEEIKSLTVITYAASKLILQKMLKICSKSSVVAANNILLANRTRGKWIEENIYLFMTDNHCKILLIETENNNYVVMSSGNFSENKIGKLEHFTIINDENILHQIKKHFNDLRNGR